MSKEIGKTVPFEPNETFVSYTDLKGNMTYVQDVFIRLSGYEEKELINQPHNMIRHSKMPQTIFKLFWDFIKAGKAISAYVINKTANGEYYWVIASAYAYRDLDGQTKNYLSIRLKPTSEFFPIIQDVYAQLLEYEKEHGYEEETCLDKLVEIAKRLNYDTYEKLMQDIIFKEFDDKFELLTKDLDVTIDRDKTDVLLADAANYIDNLYKKSLSTDALINEINEISDNLIAYSNNIVYSLTDITIASQNAAILSIKLGEEGRGFSVVSQNIKNISDEGNVLSDSVLESMSKLTNLLVVEEQVFSKGVFIKQGMILVKTALRDYLQGKSNDIRLLIDIRKLVSFNINYNQIFETISNIQGVIVKMSRFSVDLKSLSILSRVEAANINHSEIKALLEIIQNVATTFGETLEDIDNFIDDIKNRVTKLMTILKDIYNDGNKISFYIMAYQHDLFVENVKKLVSNGSFKELTEYHTCDFGKFYYDEIPAILKAASDSSAKYIYQDIEPHHIAVHEIGQQIIDLSSNGGDKSEIERLIRALEEHKNDVISLMLKLGKNIAIE